MRPFFRSDTGLSRIAAPARPLDQGEVPLVDHDPHGMMQVFRSLMIGICHPLEAQLLVRRLLVVKLTRTGGNVPVQIQTRSTFAPTSGPSRSVCLGEEEDRSGYILRVESITIASFGGAIHDAHAQTCAKSPVGETRWRDVSRNQRIRDMSLLTRFLGSFNSRFIGARREDRPPLQPARKECSRVR